MNGELSHARKQRRAIEAHAHSGSARAADATFGLAQDVGDAPPLFLEVFREAIYGSLMMQLANRFLHNTDNLFASTRR